MDECLSLSRRVVLMRVSYLMPRAALFACGVAGGHARASKVAKQDFGYQDKPKQGKSCSSCRLFTPSASGPGSCAVVDGEISPSGWCMAYSPRSE